MNIDYVLDIVNKMTHLKDEILPLSGEIKNFQKAMDYISSARQCMLYGLREIDELKRLLKKEPPPLEGGASKLIRPLIKI